MMNGRPWFVSGVAALVCWLLMGSVQAAGPEGAISRQEDIITQKSQDIASRRREEENQYRLRDTMTRTDSSSASLEAFSLPEEDGGFLLKHLYLKPSSFSHRFRWVDTFLSGFEGRRIGRKGIQALETAINKEIMDRGYVTSRVYIEPQDLSKGTFYFTLLPGIVSDIRFSPDTWGTWRNAAAVHKGSLLNIRGLEQTLDNFNHVPGQKAHIRIVPGEKEGDSVLLIELQRERPVSLFMTMDNSGMKETGKLQQTYGLRISNPLSLNDLFYFSWNGDAEPGSDRKGTHGVNLFYDIPLGKDRMTLSYEHDDYRQTVDYSVVPFISSGKLERTRLTWSHLLQRKAYSKTDLLAGILHKTRHSYIDGTEIGVQRQKTTALELGIRHKRYIKESLVEGELTYRRGVPWMADPGPTDGMAGEATTRYNMYLGSLHITTPVPVTENYRLRYTMDLYFQKANQPVYGSEFLSIGGRYSVRGFDGENTLAAESGVVMRNELALPLGKSGQEIYGAWDYGRVYGPSTEYLLGKELTGCALGFRGEKGPFRYDGFIGWPIEKPGGFQTAKRTCCFLISAEI